MLAFSPVYVDGFDPSNWPTGHNDFFSVLKKQPLFFDRENVGCHMFGGVLRIDLRISKQRLKNTPVTCFSRSVLVRTNFFFAEIRSAKKKSNCAASQKVKNPQPTWKMDTWRPNRAIRLRTNCVSQTFAEIETRTFSHKKTVFTAFIAADLTTVAWTEAKAAAVKLLEDIGKKKRKKKINRKQNENSISCHLTVWWICECFSFFLCVFRAFFQIENFFAFATVSRPGNGW